MKNRSMKRWGGAAWLGIAAMVLGAGDSALAIEGTNVCSGSPTSCTQRSNGEGIDSGALPGGLTSNRLAIAVSNGTIRGVGGHGLRLNGGTVSVDRVLVVHSGRSGIKTANSGSITNCGVFQTGEHGIETTGVSTITGNRLWQNRDSGIETALSFGAGLIQGNVSHFNGDHGIHVRGFSGLVLGNTITSNRGIGLRMDSATTAYRDNIMTSNDSLGSSVQVQGGTSLGTNLCSDAICP